MKARPFDREVLDAGAAVDQCLQERLDAGIGQLEMPDAVAQLGAGRKRGPPGALGRPGAQPDLRLQPVPRRRDAAFEADPAAGDDRDPLAQPLGMGDDVGGEDDRRTRRRLLADERFEPALVDRVEP